MGTGNLTDRVNGQTIDESFFNDIHSAFNGTFVGRNSSGTAAASQSLGSAAIPWGTLYANNISLNGSALDTSSIVSPANRVVSGQVRSTSNQPAFLKPAGTGNGLSADIEGATTNLVLAINSSSVTVSTDITVSSLTAAPSTNNTCLVNDTDAADQSATRTWGEFLGEKRYITIDTIGTEISALDGTYQAFSINNGSTTEYFYAYVDTSNNRLSKISRGFFYNSSYAPVNRIVFSNNDTITLMKAAYFFVENNATTVDVSYTAPAVSFTAPSGPATGDYWFDLGNQTWKRYNGSSFEIINRTFVGIAISDDTDTVAARSNDFYFQINNANAVEVELLDSEIAQGIKRDQKLYVYGSLIDFSPFFPSWNITTDRATSADMYAASEQSSTYYFLYISDEGETIMSDIEPYKRDDLGGYYHPHNPWNCVGVVFNDSSSDLTNAYNAKSYFTGVAPSIPAPITISSTGTAPTKGTTDTDEVTWNRESPESQYAIIEYRYAATAAGSAGTGEYTPEIPAELGEVDTSLVNVYNGSLAGFTAVPKSHIGGGAMSTATGPAARYVMAALYDSTRFRLFDITGGQIFGTGYAPFSQTVGFYVRIRVPILKWK